MRDPSPHYRSSDRKNTYENALTMCGFEIGLSGGGHPATFDNGGNGVYSITWQWLPVCKYGRGYLR